MVFGRGGLRTYFKTMIVNIDGSTVLRFWNLQMAWLLESYIQYCVKESDTS